MSFVVVSVKNCLEQHKTKNLILQKEIIVLETERRDAENLNSIIQSNCAVLSRNFEGNLKNVCMDFDLDTPFSQSVTFAGHRCATIQGCARYLY